MNGLALLLFAVLMVASASVPSLLPKGGAAAMQAVSSRSGRKVSRAAVPGRAAFGRVCGVNQTAVSAGRRRGACIIGYVEKAGLGSKACVLIDIDNQ